MKYLPACILLACSCIVEMHLAFSISCLMLGTVLTLGALGTPTLPLIYNTAIEQGDPMFFGLIRNEEEDGPSQNGDFDYD